MDGWRRESMEERVEEEAKIERKGTGWVFQRRWSDCTRIEGGRLLRGEGEGMEEEEKVKLWLMEAVDGTDV